MNNKATKAKEFLSSDNGKKYLPQASRQVCSCGKTLKSKNHVSIHTIRNETIRGTYAIGTAPYHSIKTA